MGNYRIYGVGNLNQSSRLRDNARLERRTRYPRILERNQLFAVEERNKDAPSFSALSILVASLFPSPACQDVAFDNEAGLKSAPSLLGVPAALRLAALCHAMMILSLVGLELTYPLGKIFCVGIAAVAVLLLYEHALVRPEDLGRKTWSVIETALPRFLELRSFSLVGIALVPPKG